MSEEEEIMGEYESRLVSLLNALCRRYDLTVEEADSILDGVEEHPHAACFLSDWRAGIDNIIKEMESKYNVFIEHSGDTVSIVTDASDESFPI